MGRRPATNDGSSNGPAGGVLTGGPATSCRIGLEDLDAPAVAAPPARHLLDRLVEHLHVLDTELSAHREVVEGAGVGASVLTPPTVVGADGRPVERPRTYVRYSLVMALAVQRSFDELG